MKAVIIKEGPLVFLRNLLTMEIIASILLFSVSFLGNYELYFKYLGLHNYLRFDVFEVIISALFQIIYINLLFLDWYFSHYEIRENEIIRKSGLLFRKRKSVSLSDVASVEIYQSPLGRMMNHATIVLEHNNQRITKIKNVSNFEEYVKIIKKMIYNSSGKIISRDVKTLIEEGEGLFLEFKETLRYDIRKKEVNKEMEKAVMKTIVGFLNASGGTLIIGVNDEGQIMGLDNDYKTLQQKKNKDGFENYINTLIKNMIGLSFAKYINIKFEKVEIQENENKENSEREVCIVTVKEAHKPAYLTNGDNKEDFFVRVGNSTQPFSMSEASEYIKAKWN
jgi:membrane protein YdbS with pleckstrin-like domain